MNIWIRIGFFDPRSDRGWHLIIDGIQHIWPIENDPANAPIFLKQNLVTHR